LSGPAESERRALEEFSFEEALKFENAQQLPKLLREFIWAEHLDILIWLGINLSTITVAVVTLFLIVLIELG
jgi:hypothetical protein